MLSRVFPVLRSDDGVFLEYSSVLPMANGDSSLSENQSGPHPKLEICFHTKEAWNLFEVSELVSISFNPPETTAHKLHAVIFVTLALELAIYIIPEGRGLTRR